MWKLIGVGAAALLVGCGGGGDAAGEEEDGRYDLGNGVSVEVRDVMDPVQVQVPPEMTADMRHPVEPGTRWVAVDLAFHNDGDEFVNLGLDGYGVRLHTADGREATLVSPRDTVEPMPEIPTALPPDSSVRGWQVYIVPEGVEPATLIVYGEVGDDPVTVEL
jgi:hypothetical protein